MVGESFQHSVYAADVDAAFTAVGASLVIFALAA